MTQCNRKIHETCLEMKAMYNDNMAQTDYWSVAHWKRFPVGMLYQIVWEVRLAIVVFHMF